MPRRSGGRPNAESDWRDCRFCAAVASNLMEQRRVALDSGFDEAHHLAAVIRWWVSEGLRLGGEGQTVRSFVKMLAIVMAEQAEDDEAALPRHIQ